MAQKVTVKSGQTLSSIAKANGTTVAALKKANPVLATNPKYNGGKTIFAGTKLNLPGTTSTKGTGTAQNSGVNTTTLAGINAASGIGTGSTTATTLTPNTGATTKAAPTNVRTLLSQNQYTGNYSTPGSQLGADPNSLSSSVPQTKDTLSMAQLQKQFGIAAAVIGADPSLKAALERILGANGGPMITDPYLQEQIIKESSWWRDQTDTQRQFAWAKETNPGQFAADIQANASEIVKKFAANGLQITAEQAVNYAQQMMQQAIIKDGKVVRYDTDYLNQLMANAIDFTKNDKIGDRVVYTKLSGNLETLAQSLYKQAWDYGFPQTMSNSGFGSWFEASMKGLVAGTLNPQQIDDQLQARAKSFAPGLANLIDQGQTLRQAADPWLSAIADTWELGNPNAVDLNDETVQRVLNYTDEKGNVSPVNLYDAKKMARRNVKMFDATQQAKEEKTRIASTVLRDMGFLG